MRLLHRGNDGRLYLTKELVGDNIPRYAILSHTWGPDNEEVTFKDFLGGPCSESAKEKRGYGKLEICMQQANQDHI
jgi:hypothetical protein